ncbi:polycystin-1-like protein 2 [Branchiostoma floridae x Branchiostoma belcheri]
MPVSPDSTAKQTVCLCNHMTPFGAEIVTTPNVIKFKTVFAKFVNLKDNLAVFITVFATLGLYIILLLLVRRWDKWDLSKWAVKEIPGSPGSDAHASQYLMTVHTGHDWEAGTRSKVTFTLYGDQYDSGVREMPQNERTFEMAGTDNFLLKTSQPLGDLISLKMSHDNSGEGQYASWHLHKVVITHLDTNKRTTFVCDDWLDEVYSAGKFSRTIHAQSEMDLSFGPTFKTAIRNKFTDGHLWLSVGTRRPRSYFTRVQRLSCCLCLLYCKMIASAMWFRTAGQVASPALFTIGPVDITTQQLWISVVTTLQIFPVNFAIVQIFRRCRPKDKASVDPAGENPKSAKYQVRKKWRASMMPHWFIYLAWAMLVLASLVSAFFLVLYSMEWGNDKSIQWLTTFGLSFGHSMFIVHPGKAVFVVLVMTILCRRRVSQGPGDMMMDELIFTTGGSPEPEHNVPASEPVADTSSKDSEESKDTATARVDVAKQRKQKRKKDKLLRFGKQFVAYILYVIFALMVVNETWEPTAYHAHHDMKGQLVDGFDKVQKREDILLWMRAAFTDNLYPETEYNGGTISWEERVFIHDVRAYRLGPVRIQQWRAETEPCTVTKPALIHLTKRCLLPWHDSFRHGGNFFTNVTASALHKATTSYGRGGYTVDLGEDPAQMRSVLTAMIRGHWLDRLTSTVQVDFSLYNADASMFHALRLAYKFLPTGDVAARFSANSFKTINNKGVYATVVFLSKAGFVGCVIYLAFNLYKTGKKEGKLFFSNYDNLLEVASLFASLVVIALDVAKVVIKQQTESRIHQQRNQVDRSFIDLDQAAQVNEYFVNAVAALVCFTTLRLCRFLDQISARIEFFSDNVRLWAGHMLGCLIIFLMLIAGYSMLGTLLFSPYLRGYKSLPDASASLLLMFWKKNDVDWLGLNKGILGPMYVFSFAGATVFLMFHLTAAVMLGATALVRGERAGKGGGKSQSRPKAKGGRRLPSGKWVKYLKPSRGEATVPTYESEV